MNYKLILDAILTQYPEGIQLASPVYGHNESILFEKKILLKKDKEEYQLWEQEEDEEFTLLVAENCSETVDYLTTKEFLTP